ncbi:MAG: HAMP domain-containing protein, partial [Gammaproteobacteria bacterium]|nr:HAMP domain-containing protein [Gammaproteobacteria bacterium]
MITSFRLKTVIGIAVIEAVLLGILIYNVLGFLHQSGERQLVDRVDTTARLFASMTTDAVIATDLAAVESVVAELMTTPDLVYARVRNREGVVLAAAGDAQVLAQPFQPDSAITSITDAIYDATIPIAVKGVNYGRVELGIDIAALQRIERSAQRFSLILAVVEMGLVALFSLFLGHYLTRQLSALTTAAGKIARGEFGYHLPVKGSDELAMTAAAFNRMSSHLFEYIQRRNAVMNMAVDAIFTLDSRDRVAEFNPATLRIFATIPEEMLNVPLLDRLIINYPPELPAWLQRQRAMVPSDVGDGHHFDFEATGQRYDGSQFATEITISLTLLESMVLTTVYLRDISDRVAAENSLKLSEERLKFVLEATGEGVWDWLIPQQRVHHNHHWCDILGLSHDYLEHEI